MAALWKKEGSVWVKVLLILLASFKVLRCFSVLQQICSHYNLLLASSFSFQSGSISVMPEDTVASQGACRPRVPMGGFSGPSKGGASCWWAVIISGGRYPFLPQLQPCPVRAAVRHVSWTCFPGVKGRKGRGFGCCRKCPFFSGANWKHQKGRPLLVQIMQKNLTLLKPASLAHSSWAGWSFPSVTWLFHSRLSSLPERFLWVLSSHVTSTGRWAKRFFYQGKTD